ALAMENKKQREQYEHCLDEVRTRNPTAVSSLQTDLKEECLKLRNRVLDLEQQNRTLSTLFLQQVWPTSNLLLQESQQNGTVGLPVKKCQSQLSLTVPVAAYPRSSCSSSELSLSSICSERSSDSYSCNDGWSCSKLSSLTWEKRVSLGSSAPGNICGLASDHLPTRKECHILAGLKKLQKHRLKKQSSLTNPCYKDCMNSNEGIYSLGIQCGQKCMLKPSTSGKTTMFGEGSKKLTDDSDEADDESPYTSGQHHGFDGRDCWMYSKKLTHSVSDSMCCWRERHGHDPTKCSSSCSTKEPVEKLMNFSNGLLSGRTIRSLSLLHLETSSPEINCCLHLSDTDELEDSWMKNTDNVLTVSHPGEQLERDLKGFSREKNNAASTEGRNPDHTSTQTNEGKTQPISQVMFQKEAKDLDLECISAVFGSEKRQPTELNSQFATAKTLNKVTLDGQRALLKAEYTKLVPQERPDCENGANTKTYVVLESLEKPVKFQSCGMASSITLQNSGQLQKLIPQQQKLIKPQYNHSHKVHCVPSMHSSCPINDADLNIPAHGRGLHPKFYSPDKDSAIATNTCISSPCSNAQDKSLLSPPVKLSRFIKPPGGGYSHSYKVTELSSELHSQCNWSKSPNVSHPGSPLLQKKHLEHVDFAELPSRDRHYDSGQNKLRSPSPPPPPGRSTSLLIRPNYENSPQAVNQLAQPPALIGVRESQTGSHNQPEPTAAALNAQLCGFHKGSGITGFDINLTGEVTPQKLVEISHQPIKAFTFCHTTAKGSPTHVLIESTDSKSFFTPATSLPPQKCSVQSPFNCKNDQSQENGQLSFCKTSCSLPLSLEGHYPYLTEQSGPPLETLKTPFSHSGLESRNQNSAEKSSKLHIPDSLKDNVKPLPSIQKSSTIPEKEEKEHINTGYRGGETAEAFSPCPTLKCSTGSLNAAEKLQPEMRVGVHYRSVNEVPLPQILSESGVACNSESQLFQQSVSPHLQPALGTNGAKARSQSFSVHYTKKPCIKTSERIEKVRSQIIKNNGEKGSFLNRHSSLMFGLQLKPNSGSRQNSSQQSFNQPDPHGFIGCSGSSSAILSKGKGHSARTEAGKLAPQKESCRLALTEKISHNLSRRPVKVTSYPQFDSTPSVDYGFNLAPQESRILSPKKMEIVNNKKISSPEKKGPQKPKKHMVPSTCSIEEKVMMGIVENVQNVQVQNKTQAPETKHKASSSLASWFGFNKSKIPALNGKKTDGAKEKGEKKEVKVESAQGGRQFYKKKDKKQNEPQVQDSVKYNAEKTDKPSPIIDHCNIQAGHVISHFPCPTTHIVKGQQKMEHLNG
ncbi:nck-associated protein 5 isoform X4, partial [Arapaima gigas]